MVALARQLPLDQRHGAAHRVRYQHLFNLARVADKEVWILQQKIADGAIVQQKFALFLLWLPDIFHR
ncbi:Uncharacterised protein [Klebsiella pneumoniae]|nr:Uncharacterised protein [Klebsiella pneumoniae]